MANKLMKASNELSYKPVIAFAVFPWLEIGVTFFFRIAEIRQWMLAVQGNVSIFWFRARCVSRIPIFEWEQPLIEAIFRFDVFTFPWESRRELKSMDDGFHRVPLCGQISTMIVMVIAVVAVVGGSVGRPLGLVFQETPPIGARWLPGNLSAIRSIAVISHHHENIHNPRRIPGIPYPIGVPPEVLQNRSNKHTQFDYKH